MSSEYPSRMRGVKNIPVGRRGSGRISDILVGQEELGVPRISQQNGEEQENPIISWWDGEEQEESRISRQNGEEAGRTQDLVGREVGKTQVILVGREEEGIPRLSWQDEMKREYLGYPGSMRGVRRTQDISVGRRGVGGIHKILGTPYSSSSYWVILSSPYSSLSYWILLTPLVLPGYPGYSLLLRPTGISQVLLTPFCPSGISWVLRTPLCHTGISQVLLTPLRPTRISQVLSTPLRPTGLFLLLSSYQDERSTHES